MRNSRNEMYQNIAVGIGLLAYSFSKHMPPWLLISIFIIVSIMCIYGAITSILNRKPYLTVGLYILISISSSLLAIYLLINSYLLSYKQYSKFVMISMFSTFIMAMIVGFMEKAKYGTEKQKKNLKWVAIFTLSLFGFILYIVITL